MSVSAELPQHNYLMKFVYSGHYLINNIFPGTQMLWNMETQKFTLANLDIASKFFEPMFPLALQALAR